MRHPCRRRSPSTNTDQNGTFSFKSLPAGKYQIIAKLPSATPEVPSIKSEPQTVTLADREHQTVQAKLVLPKSE
jgi:hypothetical protein